ncbi:hypothetical protein NAEGRDRAFT_81833 [Naegleria gruberi]|uniref:Uncharacterized protein n=1 Tax=Naegleria gruberi TaxID=5762 RepID=D2VZK9_NAEGR|nr:uncharacterized protein NAEGRDRAFT_81833 [Naegleria gruberi]EFC37719.1 hypothetical protein NAEGRDRAFT_81833 [Naegleria gruberi]|eukprot:XP_002670463.1 hypothetical protein NAEGRDRAFT_81833 [Naegleria gruberi strain NEG-M]
MKSLSLKGLKKGNNNTADIFEYDLNSSRGSRTLAIVNLNASFETAGISPRIFTGQLPEEGQFFTQLTPRRTSPVYSHNSSYIVTNNNTTTISSVNNSFVFEPVPSPIEFNNNSGTFHSNTKRCVSIPTTPIVPLTSPTSEDGDSSFSDEFLMASTTPSRAQSATSSIGGRRFTPKKSARKPLDIKPKEHVQLFSTSSSQDVDPKKRRNSVSGSVVLQKKNNNMSTQSIDYLKHQPPPESPRINSARGISRRVQSADPKNSRRPSTPTVSFKQIRPPSSSSTTSTAIATPSSSTGSTGWKPNTSTTSLPTPRMAPGRLPRKKSFALNPSLKSQLEAIKSVPLFLPDDIDPSHKSVKDNVSPLFLNQVIESLFVKEDKLVEKARLYNEFKEGEERIDRHTGSTPRGSTSSTFNKNSFYPNAYKAASLASVRVEKENLMMENPFLLRKSQAGIHADHFGVQAPISSRSLSSSRASTRR